MKKELSKQKFYVSFPISGNYDLETGTFTIKIPHSDFLNINNNELDQEISISTSSDYIWGHGSITLKLNEDTAVKIENNKCDLVLIGNIAPELRENYIIFVPSDYYIVNSADGSIIPKVQ